MNNVKIALIVLAVVILAVVGVVISRTTGPKEVLLPGSGPVDNTTGAENLPSGAATSPPGQATPPPSPSTPAATKQAIGEVQSLSDDLGGMSSSANQFNENENL